jgi:branched-chain amino acid transport system ATP-binding protein/branched-chain amino acid transport system permease protein
MVGYQRRLAYNAFDAAVRTPRFRAQEERCRSAAISLLAFVDLADYAQEKARFLPFACAPARNRALSPPRRAWCF